MSGSSAIKVKVLDEDLIADLITYLEEIERNLNKAFENLEELKTLLEGKVEVP